MGYHGPILIENIGLHMSLMIAERPNGVSSERALAVLWQRATALRDGLVTQDGRRLWVSYPGRPNPRAGPDFLDARLVTESGEAVTGDVELHLNAPDWYGHRHHLDPNYNGVVLHVVLSAKGHTTSLQRSNMEAPVASLQAFTDVLNSMPNEGREPPVETAEMEDRLDLAGDERFFSRSRGFTLEMDADSPDQVIYRSLMEALGYASNRNAFRRLADRVPFAALAAMSDEPASTQAIAIHATLLHASGLKSYGQDDPELRRLLRLAQRLPRFRPLSRDLWKLFRVRPSNHPLRRLRGAVQILHGSLKAGLAQHFRDSLASEGAGGVERLLLVKPFIGTGRARDIAVNVALPFLHAWADRADEASLTDLALKAYRDFPGLSGNEITREMRKRLLIPASVRLSARRHQGLMHLYRSGRRSASE